jgi:alkyl hydroperoxide reductase subunit F
MQMLDQEVIEQLRSVFGKLTGEVILRYAESDHPAQAELEEMLREVASASDRIRVERLPDAAGPAPGFEVVAGESGPAPAGAPAGGEGDRGRRGRIAFRGVPGGHEFSSLVLAILNRDGKGRLPDAGIVERIRALRGPVRLKTYVSLSCENCPEVAQALNLMASLHPDFHHETVDGAVAQDEVAALGLQGVPSVVGEGALLHSGKSQLVDLLAMLEGHFGREPAGTAARDLGAFDVAVIGGGPAGTSAAIYSARKGLKTALIAERVGGQLRDTKGIENMISMAYTEGPRLAAQLAEHLGRYPVQVFEHRRVAGIGAMEGGARGIRLEGGETLAAKAVIVATGAKWRQLGVPGEKEHIGQGVAFCAHCDGPFYQGKRVAVVGGGNSGVEAALDLANLASHVTLLEYGPKLKADSVLLDKLMALPNAAVLTRAKSTRILGDGKRVFGLEYQDQESQALRTLDVDGVFVQIGLSPNSQCVKDQLDLTPRGEIVVDAMGRTSAPGIYAAGDVTTIPFKQIVVAMGDGAKVALTAFEDRMRRKAA